MRVDVSPKINAGFVVGAIGVVYGDIGTSPLYAIKECFVGAHPLALDPPHILGILSLIFWSLMIVVSTKYTLFMMRADNRGEGGSLALLALITRRTRGSRWAFLAALLGIFAAALFYGDSMITPAISVLSAVEGLRVAAPVFDSFVVPLTLVILVTLFAIQRYGAAAVGKLFGPVMSVWFVVLAALGVASIAEEPRVLAALDPRYAIDFFYLEPGTAFLTLGTVVLALTGAEALYADMGHFGKAPIRIAWYMFVLPALLLNYFGQGALLLRTPAAIENPFYHLAPQWAMLPLLLLAACAAVIASQAVISGAFSVCQQAMHLGYLPRLTVIHTSSSKIGQIYVPFVNWTLLISVSALVLGFQSSSNLASAYGVAVTGTMLIDSMLLAWVMVLLWRWSLWLVVPIAGSFLLIDAAFFSANITKISHGGWFPLVVALVTFTLLSTWKRGRAILFARIADDAMPMEMFIRSALKGVVRVAGTAIFLTSMRSGVPHALLHNLKHNKVLHERVVMLTVVMTEVPHVDDDKRIELQDLGDGFYWLTVKYGFIENINIPEALKRCAAMGRPVDLADTSFFLSRVTIIPSVMPGMAQWRERLFAWLSRNAESPMTYFKIPANRVVELGSQIEI